MLSRWLPLLLFVATNPLFAAAAVREAPRAWLHVDGYSHHFEAGDANSELFGLGLTWQRRTTGSMTTSWEADVFRDSGCELSAYLGHSWAWTLGRVRLGATGAVMYHRNFSDYNGLNVMPVVLPFLEVPLRPVKLRVYYVPPVRRASDHQVAIQLLIPLRRL